METEITTARISGISRLRMDRDGPGIRTLVPLSGCHLDCAYCINGQLRKFSAGEEYTPERLLEWVRLDDIYFRASGGGITFGGGEPLLHSGFIRRFREICPGEWSIAVETSLNVPREDAERLLGAVDLWIVDIKETDAQRYLEYTGETNELALANLRLLQEKGMAPSVIVRIPRIGGLNTPEDVERSVGIIGAMGFRTEVFEYVIPRELLKGTPACESLPGSLVDPDSLPQEIDREERGNLATRLKKWLEEVQLLGIYDNDEENDGEDWDD